MILWLELIPMLRTLVVHLGMPPRVFVLAEVKVYPYKGMQKLSNTALNTLLERSVCSSLASGSNDTHKEHICSGSPDPMLRHHLNFNMEGMPVAYGE